jgi:hypothetical protein
VSDAAAGLSNLTLHVPAAPDQADLLDLSEASETKGAPVALTRAAAVAAALVSPKTLVSEVERLADTAEFKAMLDQVCSQEPTINTAEARRTLKLELAHLLVAEFKEAVQDKSNGQAVEALRVIMTAGARFSKGYAAAKGRDLADWLPSTEVSRAEVAEFEQLCDFGALYAQNLTPRLRTPKFTAFVESVLCQLQTEQEEYRRRPVAQALVIVGVICGGASCECGPSEAVGKMDEGDRRLVDYFIDRLIDQLRNDGVLAGAARASRLRGAGPAGSARDEQNEAVQRLTLEVLRQMLSRQDFHALLIMMRNARSEP